MAAALRYYRATYGSDLSTEWGHGHGYADGGLVTGHGGPRSDNLWAWLSSGEYVVNAHAAQRNMPLLDAINSSTWNPVALDSGTLSGPATAPQTSSPVRDHSVHIGTVHAFDNDGMVRALDRYQEQQMMGALAAYS
jgi:trimeric autotransporter adhesin